MAIIKITLVLIDDNKLIRNKWIRSAKIKDIKLLVFASIDEFYKECENIQKNCVVFIDSELGNGILGEDEARKLFFSKEEKFGFKNIYLTTANDREDFLKMRWIIDVVGKDPPWEDSKSDFMVRFCA